MRAIVAYMERVDGHLLGAGKLIEGSTQKDIRLAAKTLCKQNDWRLLDIILDCNPLWDNYLQHINREVTA